MVTTVKRHGAGTTVRDVRALFTDPHVHAALIVEGDLLLAVVDRADVMHAADGDPAARHGQLASRLVGPDVDLGTARHHMLASGRRRLAVVAADGALLGLLCLKRTRTGFCTDAGVRARLAGR